MTGTLSVEVERYFVQAEHLRMIYEETKSCLAEVDYEHHFDKSLYKAAAWSADDDSSFFSSVTAHPRFIVLGASPSAKAAVVNELLGCAVLPTIAAEDVEEKGGPVPASLEIWRTILIRYGPKSQYRLVSDGDDSTVSRIDESDLLALAPSMSNLSSAVPVSAVRYRSLSKGKGVSGKDFLELLIAHPLLKDGSEILVPGYRNCAEDQFQFPAILSRWSESCAPLLVYVVTTQTITETDRIDLVSIRQTLPEQPVFFIKSRPYVRSDLPESDRYPGLLPGASGSGMFLGSSSMEDNSGSFREFPQSSVFRSSQHRGVRHRTAGIQSSSLNSRPQFVTCFSAPSSDSESADTSPLTSPSSIHSSSLCHQLVDLGFLSPVSSNRGRVSRRHTTDASSCSMAMGGDVTGLSDLIETSHDFPRLIWFVQRVLRSRLIILSSTCNQWHCALLNLFILTAFDMARDQLITPKRLIYAKDKENELYAELVAATQKKQEELQHIFLDVIDGMREELLNETTDFSIEGLDRAEAGGSSPTRNITSAARTTAQIQQYILTRVNTAIAERLMSSLQCLQQTFVGTLSRCLESLEGVELCDESKKEGACASKALKQLLNAAYSLEVSLPMSGSVVQILLQKMKQVGMGLIRVFLPCYPLCSGRMGDWESDNQLIHADSPDASTNGDWADSDNRHTHACVITKGLNSGNSLQQSELEWRRDIAATTLTRLSEIKLAKVLCSQFRDRVKTSHEAFQQALDRLDGVHSERLAKTEQQRLKLRKEHAPRLARLAMESMAQRDSLLHGMPKIGHEIGRGQYGVVYACDRWGGHGPCAVKSVVPPDDKHWNDLALEFYYTRSLPEHERVVRLHGAVIDHSYGGGGGQPAVLLIMERMKRDLYSAIRAGLSWPARLRVALDVVDGMRFLHSQGLVHRDIKLKNVLMDECNRGKITDLGFCKPEAMMSGSVVGTPIHMAPELFSGGYDSSVDVYAFGVLFWYICAGHVRLPQAFEACYSKDQLWHSVRKGLRPEQLSNFDNECWVIMRDCWTGDSSKRPHLGDIRPRLQRLLDQYLEANPDYSSQSSVSNQSPNRRNELLNFPDDRTGRRRLWKR